MMQKHFVLILMTAFLLAVMPGLSQAMLGDNDWAKEDVGAVFPPPTEPEEPGPGLWMNGCWESRSPIEQYNPIWIPTMSPNTFYEILPGVLDTEEGDKLAMLCNCRAMVKCDAMFLSRIETRGKERVRVITEVLDSKPETPFHLIP